MKKLEEITKIIIETEYKKTYFLNDIEELYKFFLDNNIISYNNKSFENPSFVPIRYCKFPYDCTIH